jgi:hypothetical protein
MRPYNYINYFKVNAFMVIGFSGKTTAIDSLDQDCQWGEEPACTDRSLKCSAEHCPKPENAPNKPESYSKIPLTGNYLLLYIQTTPKASFYQFL